MTLASRVIEQFFQLPAPLTRAVRVHRALPVTARDGVVLRTDHWEPRLGRVPTILVRSPYGRAGVIGVVCGRLLRDIVHSAFRLAGWANTASARRAHTTPASTFSLYGIP